MKALVLVAAKQFEVQDIKIPEIGPEDVLVKVQACGICGSDIPRARDGAVAALPLVLGHEFSGKIVKTGSTISAKNIGKRVVGVPLLPCHQCTECMQGHPAMCERYSFIGSRVQGAMAEYIALPYKNICLIPNTLDYQAAACVEPLTVAIHAVERVTITLGSTALVYGCGMIGLLIIQVLRAKGVEKIIAVDINPSKLTYAKKAGANICLDSQDNNVETTLRTLQPDYVFESTGVGQVQATVFDYVKKKGDIIFVGTVHKDVTYLAKSLEQILRKELNVTGSWMSYSAPFPGSEWEAAIELLSTNKVSVLEMITHRLTIEAGYEAIKKLSDPREQALKVMFLLNEEERKCH